LLAHTYTIHKRAHTHILIPTHRHARTHTHTHTHTLACVRTKTTSHMHTHARIYACTHTHGHIQEHTLIKSTHREEDLSPLTFMDVVDLVSTVTEPKAELGTNLPYGYPAVAIQVQIGKSPNIRPYTVYIYGSGQPYLYLISCCSGY
jgi:hypothetical protein